jgi:hypothetical protein
MEVVMVLPERYAGSTILEESANLIKIETPSGHEFWIPKNNSVVAPKPESGAPRRYRGPGKKFKKIGFKDADGSIIYNAEGLERQHRAFAARPRSF